MAGSPGAYGEKPKPADLTVSSSAYGLAVALNYGRTRVGMNVIWVGTKGAKGEPAGFFVLGLKGVKLNNRQLGSFGGTKLSTTEFNYYVSALWAIGEGPIQAVRWLYKDKERRRMKESLRETNGRVELVWTRSGLPGGEYWLGTDKQLPWDTFYQLTYTGQSFPGGVDFVLTGKLPEEPIAYRRTALFGRQLWPLKGTASLPQLSAEVTGLEAETLEDDDEESIGALPSNILYDLLTNPFHGAGFHTLESLREYEKYCRAEGFYLSPSYNEQAEASGLIEDVLECTNADSVVTQGFLKIVPLAEAEVDGDDFYRPPFVIAQPDGTLAIEALWEVTADDFLAEAGEEPIEIVFDSGDALVNAVTVEYLNRANLYAKALVDSKDEASIATYGLREHTLKTNGIVGGRIARHMGTVFRQRRSIVPTKYKFKLGRKYDLVEPLDIMAITYPPWGMNRVPVWVNSVGELDAGEGGVEVEVEEMATSMTSVPRYSHQDPVLNLPDFNVPPGTVTTAVLFEPTGRLTKGELEVWIGVVPDSASWGGCNVWMSESDSQFERQEHMGTLYAIARIGQVETSLPAAPVVEEVQSDQSVRLVDEAHTLPVVMIPSPRQDSATLVSRSRESAANFEEPVYLSRGANEDIPFEILSIQNAELTGPSTYNLTRLYRGGYDTPIVAHTAPATMMVLDGNILKLRLEERHIGKRLRFRFTSFNVFGGQEESLERVPDYSIQIRGRAFAAPLGAVEQLQVRLTGKNQEAYLLWKRVVDFRPVEYEIRRGLNFFTAGTIAITNGGGSQSMARFEITSNGTYWVIARTGSRVGPGRDQLVYGFPASIDVAAYLPEGNVVVEHDEVDLFFGNYNEIVSRTPSLLSRWRCGTDPHNADEGFWDDIAGAPQTGSEYSGPINFREPGGIVGDVNFSLKLLGFVGVGAFVNLGELEPLTGNWTRSIVTKVQGAGVLFVNKDGSSRGNIVGVNGSGQLYWKAAAADAVQVATPHNNLIGDNTFHQIVVTFSTNGNVVEIFLDGFRVLIRSGVVLTVTGGETWIGQDGNNADFLVGWVDEVAQFNYTFKRAYAAGLRTAQLLDAPGVYAEFIRSKAKHYFRFNERTSNLLVDDINNKTGVGSVVPIPGLLSGDSDKAIQLFGSQGVHVASPPTDAVNLTELTFEALIRPDSSAGMQMLGEFRSGSVVGPWFSIDSGTFKVNFVEEDGTDHFLVSGADTVPIDGQPHVFHACYDGDYARVYCDGNLLVAANLGAFALRTGNLGFYVGSLGGITNFYFGAIDEVALYSAALDDTGGNPFLQNTPPQLVARTVAALSAYSLVNMTVTEDGYLQTNPSAEGIFQVPELHTVKLRRARPVNVQVDWEADGVVASTFDQIPRLDTAAQVDTETGKVGASAGYARYIEAVPEVQISMEETGEDNWSTWQRVEAGQYLGLRFRTRLRLRSLRDGVLARLLSFNWRVDVPDLIQRGSITTSAAANVTRNFPKKFEAVPVVQLTMTNGATGDYVEVVQVTADAVVVSTRNSAGNRVVRNLTYLAQGY